MCQVGTIKAAKAEAHDTAEGLRARLRMVDQQRMQQMNAQIESEARQLQERREETAPEGHDRRMREYTEAAEDNRVITILVHAMCSTMQPHAQCATRMAVVQKASLAFFLLSIGEPTARHANMRARTHARTHMVAALACLRIRTGNLVEKGS